MPNFDPKPWIYQDGERWETSSKTDDEQPRYDPRPEYETEDPTPWVCPDDDERYEDTCGQDEFKPRLLVDPSGDCRG
jgi:hypothetical protein